MTTTTTTTTKKKKKKKKKATPKRSLFLDLVQGFVEMRLHREGKITLRESRGKPLTLPRVDGAFITRMRGAHGLSRAVLAQRLGLSVRSLERWEQGKSAPPRAVATLLLLVAKFPDTFDRLASLNQTQLTAPPRKNRTTAREQSAAAE